MNDSMSAFADRIMKQKYSHIKRDGEIEEWDNIAYRVSKHVLKVVDAPKSQIEETKRLISERKFIPGGRYLSNVGRPYHQVQNCLLLRAEDSREGWSELMQKITMSLMTGAGIGVDYSQIRGEGKPVRKTGGIATGPIWLMRMVNEAGRGIVNGGNRRCAIWAGLNWSHPDIHKFISIKNWIPEVVALKAKDFSFPATLDMTNISVGLDDEFFKAYADEKHELHATARSVYKQSVRHMLETGEPGFSINLGKERNETLRNAPVCGETQVLTEEGYQMVEDIVGIPQEIWTGEQWASDVVFKETSPNSEILRVSFTGGREIRCDRSHPFFREIYLGNGERRRLSSIEKTAAEDLHPGDILHVSLPKTDVITTECKDVDGYALGYAYGDGSFVNGNAAEITFCTEESKACASLVAESSLISSVNWKDGRGYVRAYFSANRPFWGGRSKEIFPPELNRSSHSFISCFLAGLFDADGNWEPTQKHIRLSSKHEGFLRGVARLLESWGILAGVSKSGHSTYGKAQTYQLVIMSSYTKRFSEFVPTIRLKPNLFGYESYRDSVLKVLSVEPDGYAPVYCADVRVPEHSFQAEGVIIGNCTEITSADDSDICNLGSINLSRIESLEEMEHVVEIGTAFLLAGTVYSDVPYSKVDLVRTKNRRLGLGLMGIHEWLLKKGFRYEANEELQKYLEIYEKSDKYAAKYAKKWDISVPVKTRAIAPTGTIGIIGETTTGIEPIFCVAYKRRYLRGGLWNFEYVVDPTAKRLIEADVPVEKIEDAYALSEDVERRVKFQVWVQKYVDHAISSTINLPVWGSEFNNEAMVQSFGDMLINYLPRLRGLTVYPDGARGGQPLTPVPYMTAINHVGEVFVESADICEITRGESCGS